MQLINSFLILKKTVVLKLNPTQCSSLFPFEVKEVDIKMLQRSSSIHFMVVVDPVVILVEHVISRLDVLPLVDAEDPIRIVAVFPDPVELNGVGPGLGQIFI